MSKLKTKKAAQKRFAVFKSLEIRRPCANRTHLLRKRSSSVKRGLKNQIRVVKSDEPMVRRLLPYN